MSRHVHRSSPARPPGRHRHRRPGGARRRCSSSRGRVDTAAGGDVVRNVEVAGTARRGRRPGRSSTPRSTAYAADLAAGRRCSCVTPNGTYDTTAAELGLAVDVEATAEAALDAGRGFVLARPFQWLRSLASPHEVEPGAHRRRGRRAEATIIALEGEARVPPTEPTFDLADDGSLALVAGIDGSGIDPADVAAALPPPRSPSGAGRATTARSSSRSNRPNRSRR